MGLGTYVYPVNVTVPAGTPTSVPVTTTPNLGWVWLDSVELRIPSGHCGLTGIHAANSGTQLFPYSETVSYLVGDDERLIFDIGQEFDTGLQIVTYNTDVFSHTFYLRFSGRPMAVVTATTPSAPATIVPVS